MEVHISRYLLLVYVDGKNYVRLFICFFYSTYIFLIMIVCVSIREKKIFLRFHLAEAVYGDQRTYLA